MRLPVRTAGARSSHERATYRRTVAVTNAVQGQNVHVFVPLREKDRRRLQPFAGQALFDRPIADIVYRSIPSEPTDQMIEAGGNVQARAGIAVRVPIAASSMGVQNPDVGKSRLLKKGNIRRGGLVQGSAGEAG